MDRGVWYDRDWMLSTITRPARNAHGPLHRKHLSSANAATTHGGHVKYFISKTEMIEFDYIDPTRPNVVRRCQKMKYFYKKAPNPR